MALSIRNLSKTYSNGVQALKDVSLEIPKGMFGLLGPNGAGKSSLMRTLATLQEADSGEAWLDDLDVLREKDKLRQVLGYLPQEFGLYPKVSAQMLLEHIASLKGVASRGERRELVEALLHKVNLYPHRKKELGTYSGGMKQRFGIAQALIGNPRLIIVDEPTAGLDPTERNRFHNLLSEIGENTVVILSTHIVDDVTHLCNSMAIISQGQVLEQGRPADIIEGMQGRVWKKTMDKAELVDHLARHQVISSSLYGGRTVLHIYSATDPQEGFEPVEAGLEDVYFHTINQHTHSLPAEVLEAAGKEADTPTLKA
ncbi:ABC transporter ATP-binding protein [Cesiribacter andamanensis]|uniref:Putative ABC transporter ATP-binding protein YbhF n=1 Tax=Cesiribacter andamanensis AMV16 TaxID=1279009 RepID=M7MXK6_9BACT|nr:ABC transporter ATP-binding protein [Cesiribacter andamanensis]EMR01178.1 putative ABC transporter ATP-binding protein YbhF [Cesiribacter andamanensis AMV16]